MKRSLVAAALSVAAAALAFGSGGSEAAAAGPVTLNVWMGSWWADQAPKIAAEYARVKPGVTVKIEPIPINSYYDKAVAAILGGSPPDVLALDAFMIAGAAGRNLLQPWDDHIKGLDVADFAPGIWSAGVVGGKVYAIPYRGSAGVVYYNKTMFDRAGLSYPTEDWNYDRMLEMARKITRPGQEYGVGIAAALSDPANVTTAFSPMLWAFGGDYLDREYKAAIINRPEGVRAITYWSELYTRHKVAPEGTPTYTTTKDLVPLFMNNKVAMIFSASQNIAQFNAEPALKWGLEVPPGRATGGGGWSYSLPTGAPNAAAARDYVLWFIRPEVLSALTVREPARISATTSPPWNSPEFKVVFRAAKYSRIHPPIPQWTEIQTMVITELQKTLQQTRTPQQAADEMATQATAILARK
jgi:multiple sugar transport system substrate-binding protein